MLFNSHEYVFLFLPLVCLVYCQLVARSWTAAIYWLTVASLGFYAWWNPANLVILLGSLAVNFLVGMRIEHTAQELPRKVWLTIGIVANLVCLVHYKYAGFFVENLNELLGWQLAVPTQVLPLGISFFTFQQIAYLCDIYHRRMAAHSGVEYGLFVSFFPQLIAGPIVRPDDILPQFRRPAEERRPRQADFAIGISLFAIGLFKKTVLADWLALYSSPIFAAAADGTAFSIFDAWSAALCYTFQLYFDFSGYSDMAVGSARLFGIRLPWNFNSPYQAASIGDFWRRWHITLSTFLREFVYFPLGGSRCSSWRRSLNLFLTMLIGGFWHGAGWTYLAWGGVHGLYLVIDHGWQRWRGSERSTVIAWWARPLTFLAVVMAWVLFRATSLSDAGALYATMFGFGSTQLFNEVWFSTRTEQILIVVSGLIVWFVPNTITWMERAETLIANADGETPLELPWGWRPNAAWGVATGLLAAVAVLRMTAISEFVYFQF